MRTKDILSFAAAGACLVSATWASKAERVDLERRSEKTALVERAIKQSAFCWWFRPQSALVRDTIYIDGGVLMWQTLDNNGIADFAYDLPSVLYYINLTVPFDTINDNMSTVILNTEKPSGNLAPPVSDGHLLANDYGFISYGGLMADTNTYDLPDENWALARDLYQHGNVPVNEKWRQIDMDITRNVAAGGYVNVPSENLAFVFSGVRSKSGEEIRRESPPEDMEANDLSQQMIWVDMAEMKSEQYHNDTMPSEIAARSSGEVVWVPAGEKGALVAFGGKEMNYEEFEGSSKNISDSTISNYNVSGKGYMETVHVYDVDQKEWYSQNTTGDIPPPTADFCSIVASAQDGSSHEIYMYGGNDGLTVNSGTVDADPNYDTVYVLSIPSFIWTRVYKGETDKARQGHRCHKISDNRMMVIGGMKQGGACVAGFVRIFNFNTLEFETKYNPAVSNEKYEVPKVVFAAIGGTKEGGADATAEDIDSDLETVLSTAYAGTVKNYWPYPVASSAGNGSSTATGVASSSSNSASGGGSSLPSYVPPLLGAILGLLVLVILGSVAYFIWKRRRSERRRLASDSAASTNMKKRGLIGSWLQGVSVDAKSNQYDETPTTEKSGYFDGATAVGSTPHQTPLTERMNPIQELGEQQIYEAPEDNVVPGELTAAPIKLGRNITIVDKGPHEMPGSSPLLPATDTASPSTSPQRPPNPRQQSSISDIVSPLTPSS